jgi:hypothetical protein
LKQAGSIVELTRQASGFSKDTNDNFFSLGVGGCFLALLPVW